VYVQCERCNALFEHNTGEPSPIYCPFCAMPVTATQKVNPPSPVAPAPEASRMKKF
jgi:hypothetical protein